MYMLKIWAADDRLDRLLAVLFICHSCSLLSKVNSTFRASAGWALVRVISIVSTLAANGASSDCVVFLIDHTMASMHRMTYIREAVTSSTSIKLNLCSSHREATCISKVCNKKKHNYEICGQQRVLLNALLKRVQCINVTYSGC